MPHPSSLHHPITSITSPYGGLMITVMPVGYVRSPRRDLADDGWGEVRAHIELVEGYEAESLEGIEDFSHAEVIFVFDRVSEAAVVRGARHPRGNPAWPRVGIFGELDSCLFSGPVESAPGRLEPSPPKPKPSSPAKRGRMR